MLSINEILSILKNATNRLPQLRFAWGLLGISAVAALIIRLLGANKAAIVVIGLTLIGVLLVFIATIAFGKTALARRPAQVVIWSVTLFFITFLSFTVTAFAISWPCNWTRFLEIPTEKCRSRPNIFPEDVVRKKIPNIVIPDVVYKKIPNIYLLLRSFRVPKGEESTSLRFIAPSWDIDITFEASNDLLLREIMNSLIRHFSFHKHIEFPYRTSSSTIHWGILVNNQVQDLNQSIRGAGIENGDLLRLEIELISLDKYIVAHPPKTETKNSPIFRLPLFDQFPSHR